MRQLRCRLIPRILKRPSLAAFTAFSILSCDSKPPTPPPPEPKPMIMKEPFKMEWKRKPLPPLEDDKPAKGPLCNDNMCKLARKGRSYRKRRRYRKLADLISFRTKDYRKNRLTYDQADKAAGYILKDMHTRSMWKSRRLLRFLPDTAVEIFRSVNERGMPKPEAEKLSLYLYRFVARVAMRRRDFDEYLSCFIGRDWKQVNHPVEGMTGRDQKRFYAGHKVPDLKTALHIYRFLKIERRRKNLSAFRLRGRGPPAPK